MNINGERLLNLLGDMLGEMEQRMIDRVKAETKAAEERLALQFENKILKAQLAQTTKPTTEE